MADFHTKTIYGQKSSIIITSPAKMVAYIFLSCINRKDDGTWQVPTKGEGKTVKLSIEEIICILEVLNRRSANWTGYHVFKDRKTEIYVGWEDESRQVILIKIGDYIKKLRFPNLNFMTLLLDHILTEKIEFATSGKVESKAKKKEKEKEKEEVDEEGKYGLFSEHITTLDGLHIVETTEYGISIDTIEIKAQIIVESPKAFLIALDTDEEFWIPKNSINNDYDVKKKKSQKLLVDKWIIEKQKILSK